jgi:hypothetical protein
MDGGRQPDAMADGDEYASHPRAGANDCTDRFAAVGERRPVAAIGAGLVPLADKPGLGYSNRRNPRQKADVAGETKTPRMRQALTVDEDEIRCRTQMLDRHKRSRRFVERQVSWPVRECCFSAGYGAFQQFEIRKIERDGGRPDTRAPRLGPSIDACHNANRAETIFCEDFAAQPLLQIVGLRDGSRPGHSCPMRNGTDMGRHRLQSPVMPSELRLGLDLVRYVPGIGLPRKGVVNMRVTIVPVGRPEADSLCIFAEDVSGAGFDATVTDRVFELAESEGRVALISFARLGANADPGKARARALKEALHELGHTLGLGHCDNSRCVMRFSNCLAEADWNTGRFCARCQVRARRLARKS